MNAAPPSLYLTNVPATKRGWWLGFSLLVLCLQQHAAAQSDDARQRGKMVEEVASMAEVGGAAGMDARVLAVMNKVPRHEFVPVDQKPHAYENRPLPIGYGQTISQPYIVAAMTELLNLKPGHVVLEIGTGSGYQAAVLAELARAVYTIEIVAPL
ncbi:MAG: hypothetical protein Q8O25_14985, partial [Sulfurisoma sp.]|nr:hypothetical protein [Sulfurisoma sp.]